MTIEQTLNRFFGTDLKHGRGVTPGVVARYLAAMPFAYNIMESLEDYCGINSVNNEQHVDLSSCRMKRDAEDISKLVFWLEEHAPFQRREYLISLSTGIIGENTMKCHRAMNLGKEGMLSMVGKQVNKVSLSLIFKVKSLADVKNSIKSQEDDYIPVDSGLLFQKIATVFQGNPEFTRQAFHYELSPYPLSLFDENGIMRKTHKSDLYKCFQPTLCSEASLRIYTFIIDGGFLLHRVVWPHGKTYRDIFEIYLRYICTHFNQDSWVVFDGYNNENIDVKSYERYRRREKNVAADVEFSEDMIVSLSQAQFLSNVANKHKFIKLLSNHLQQSGINVKVAPEDVNSYDSN